jgi:outer membrane protein assembly factor BamB
LPKRLALLACAALVAACGVKLAAPPSVFPVSNAWKARVAGAIEPPLATDGTRLFVATRDGQVQALALDDGRVVWRVKGRGRIAATADALVLRDEEGRVRRLDTASGRELWSAVSNVDGPLPPVVDGENVLVAGKGLASLSLDRGEVLWRVDGAISSAPRGAGPWIFSGEEDGALRGRERASGAVRWTFPSTGPVKAPVFVDGDHVLIGTTDGRLLALRRDKGTPRWRWKIGADVFDAADVLGSTALFVSYDNILYGLGRGNGHLRWRGILPSRPLSGPIVAGSAVFVACQETDVLAFDGRDGKRIGALQMPAEIRTAPLVVGERLYLGLRDRSVLAFGLNQIPFGTATPRPSPAPLTAPSPAPSSSAPASPSLSVSPSPDAPPQP